MMSFEYTDYDEPKSYDVIEVDSAGAIAVDGAVVVALRALDKIIGVMFYNKEDLDNYIAGVQSVRDKVWPD
jgi:hypothetical protein